MPYCVVADVQAEFKGITFSNGTAVTTARVEAFITQADAFINSRIGLVYQTPVSSGDGLEVLKEISIKLVSHRIKKILEVKTGGTQADQGEVANDRKEAIEMLNQIVVKELALAGATLLDSKLGITSYADDNDEEYTFKKGVNQW